MSSDELRRITDITMYTGRPTTMSNSSARFPGYKQESNRQPMRPKAPLETIRLRRQPPWTLMETLNPEPLNDTLLSCAALCWRHRRCTQLDCVLDHHSPAGGKRSCSRCVKPLCSLWMHRPPRQLHTRAREGALQPCRRACVACSAPAGRILVSSR